MSACKNRRFDYLDANEVSVMFSQDPEVGDEVQRDPRVVA